MQHDQILNLLKGASSQKPIGFWELQAKTGMHVGALDEALDEMYAARQINQATVMRKGITQREVWPTGVVIPTSYAIANAARVAPTPPLRHAEVKPKLMEETMNPDLKLVDAADVARIDELLAPVAEEKPRSLQVLEYIEAHPGCNNEDISKKFSFSSPVSYIKSHVEKQKVRRTYISNRVAVYHIEDGFTAASIYGGGSKNNHGHVRKASKAPKVQAYRAEDKGMLATVVDKNLEIKTIAESEEYEIPAFLRKSMELENPKLKIAYTNQKTIMLFGLTDSPIELSKADSDELIDFCAQMDLCCSVDVPTV